MPFSRRLIVVYAATAVVLVGATLFALRDRLTASPASPATANPAGAPGSRAPVAIDARRQQLIGVRTVRAVSGTLTPRLRATGVVAYDETRLVDVNLKLAGWIRDLYVNYAGQEVQAGQPLFALYSPELVAAQTQLIAAIKSREQLTPAQVAEQRDYASRLIDTPRQRLLQWDVPEDQLQALERTREVIPAIVFRSPAAGVVIEKHAIEGMYVEPGQTLYKLADLSVVWIEADFREADVSELKAGSRADVTLDAWPTEHFSGRVVHVYPYMAAETRTVKARIELTNRDRRLKPGMFAGIDVSGASHAGVLVPRDAVVDSGEQRIVFVAEGGGRFEPRQVTIGARADDRVLILSGLQEHEEVADRATFFLDSESQMRAALQDYKGTAPATASHSSGGHFDLVFHTKPDPPRSGDNVVEVTAQDPAGRPVTDADIRVIFSMPAMPTMNMPAMRAEARLTHVADGLYRGQGSIPMPGRWDVTVTASRQGQPLATSQTTFVAR